jgi:hypothetical protein
VNKETLPRTLTAYGTLVIIGAVVTTACHATDASTSLVAEADTTPRVLSHGPGGGGIGNEGLKQYIAALTSAALDPNQRTMIGSASGEEESIDEAIARWQALYEPKSAPRSGGAQFYEYYNPSVGGNSQITVDGRGPGVRTARYYGVSSCTAFPSDTYLELHSEISAKYNDVTMYHDYIDIRPTWTNMAWDSKFYTVSGAAQMAYMQTKHICNVSNNPNTPYKYSSAVMQI